MCKCSCEYSTIKEVREDGLLNGTSASCSKCSRIKDLTGKVFGDLKVLRLNRDIHTDYNHTFYDVQCKCSKIYPVRSDALTMGETVNCGCNKLEHEDLTGRKFGKLTVLKYLYRFRYNEIKDYRTSVNIWLCECECGSIIPKRQGDLLNNHVQSCGCETRSRGEIEIAKSLNCWGVKYIEQYRFDDCKYKNTLPFDFALIDSKNNPYCVIEFDGNFHYEAIKYPDMTQEQADENLKTTQVRDNIKTNYCKINHIPLIRIPYWEFDNGNLEYILFDELVKYGAIEEIKSA